MALPLRKDGSTNVEKGSLGSILFLLGVGFEPANAQSGGQHQHHWTACLPVPQPIVILSIPNTGYTMEYLRCFEVASLTDIASSPDWDRCIYPGCPFPDGWAAERKVRIRWSDNGAGGTFGTLDALVNFVPLILSLMPKRLPTIGYRRTTLKRPTSLWLWTMKGFTTMMLLSPMALPTATSPSGSFGLPLALTIGDQNWMKTYLLSLGLNLTKTTKVTRWLERLSFA